MHVSRCHGTLQDRFCLCAINLNCSMFRSRYSLCVGEPVVWNANRNPEHPLQWRRWRCRRPAKRRYAHYQWVLERPSSAQNTSSRGATYGTADCCNSMDEVVVTTEMFAGLRAACSHADGGNGAWKTRVLAKLRPTERPAGSSTLPCRTTLSCALVGSLFTIFQLRM